LIIVHILEDALERYAMRTLADSEIEPLEEHLLMCAECRDRFVAVMRVAEGPPKIGG
jgi:hypothetical protein